MPLGLKILGYVKGDTFLIPRKECILGKNASGGDSKLLHG